MADKISRFLSGLFATGAGLSMLAVFLIVFVNSTRRYTIGKSFEWGEELPVYLAIYGVMFGAAWAYLEDRHVRFTLLVGFIPEATRRYLYMFVDLVVAVCGGLLAWSGILFAEKRGAVEASGLVNLSRDLHSLTNIDALLSLGTLYPWQFAMVIGGGMMALAAVVKLITRIVDRTGSDPLPDSPVGSAQKRNYG